MSSFLPLIKWGKEKKREKDEKKVIRFSSLESRRCVALFTVKVLLRRTSLRDRVSPSRMTCRILSLTRSGDLDSGLIDLERASFILEVVSPFQDGVYKGEGEGVHRLDASVNCFSPWGSELFLKIPQRRCDTSPSYVSCRLQNTER